MEKAHGLVTRWINESGPKSETQWKKIARQTKIKVETNKMEKNLEYTMKKRKTGIDVMP